MARILGAALVAGWALLGVPVPSAHADAACPDIQVVFARGTYEAPGVGGIGQAFVDSVKSHAGTRTVGVYPVNYPASTEFPTAVDGIRDASAHVEAMAANCPNTQLVLGGFSQGAAVMGFVTAQVIPDGAPASGVPNPMPPDVANHVAAVALFGTPSNLFMSVIQQPPVTVGPLYAAKTVEECITDDPICSNGGDLNRHNDYANDGLVDQAAVFTVSHLSAAPAPAARPPAPAATPPPPAATPPQPAPAATPPPRPPAATPPAKPLQPNWLWAIWAPPPD
jgi:cutinase